MAAKIAFNTFATGEISSSLSARYDLQKYKPACRSMHNFLVELHGDARRRPGTRFLEDIGSDAVVIPFQFSSDPTQHLVLVFTPGLIRFATTDGFIREDGQAIQTQSPYTTIEQMRALSYAQSGDVIYMAHKDFALRKLSRLSNTNWVLDTVTFDPAIEAPNAPTVTFTSGPVGGSQVAQQDFILHYRVSAVGADGSESYASAAGAVSGRHPSDWISGDRVTLTFPTVSGAVEYNIYREEGGYFGLIGVTKTNSFIDVKYVAETSKTPMESYNPFAGGNHPGLVTFHEQRLILAGTEQKPQTVYGSQVANYEGFFRRSPLKDDDPYEFTIASGSIDAINWAQTFGELLLGTGGAEFQVTGGNSSITPSNVQVKQQSYWGSTKLRPLIIGNSILHVQRQGSRVRDLFFSLEKDGYAGNDLTVLAPHLFDGHSIVQWAYQQAPGSVVWAVRNDGVLLGLTYMKEHEIWAWHRHDTQGSFRSVCSISGELEDTTFFVVSRVINGQTRFYLELLQPKWVSADGVSQAFFVDSGLSYEGPPVKTLGGLEHLEGAGVQILADGSPVEGQVVTDGCVTIPYESGLVHVGLGYKSELAPMPPEAETKEGSTLGRIRTVGKSRIRVLDTVGGKYGSSSTDLWDFPYLPDFYDSPVPPYSGDLEFTPDTRLDSQTTVFIVQDRPLPMTVIALMLEVDIEG